MPADIADIRSFNRYYTRVVGLLDDGILHSDFALGEARVIHEIGKREPVTAAEITDELAMDKSQLSRILARLKRRGVVASARCQDDGRAAALQLTEKGENACAILNAMSDEAVAGLIAHLDGDGLTRLTGAMHDIRTLIGDGASAETGLKLRGPRIGELGWLIYRQATLYNLEYGWDNRFETLIARIYAEFEEAADTPPKKLWIAERGHRIAGSVFVKPNPDDPSVAQLRMLYAEPWARGEGVGRRLVDEVVGFSRESGYRRIRLWTQDCLKAARKVYQGAGFRLESEHRHRSFGHDLNGQYWELDLERA